MNPVYVFARDATGVLEMQGKQLIIGSDDYADVFVEVDGQWQADGRITPAGPEVISSVEIAGRRAFIGDPLSTTIYEYRHNGSVT
jgi:hypothetical protein